MKDKHWTLDIGGICLKLTLPPAWLEPLERAWASWEGSDAGGVARLVQDATLPAPRGPYFEARPHFAGGRCALETTGFAGEIIPHEGHALLRAHPDATAGDLSYFIRTAFAMYAFEQGALLFHAAGVVHRGAAYALFGQSGSGKTTAARLSTGKPVLNDDLLLLRPGEAGWEVWATPFGRRRGDLRSAPLRAFLRLLQAAEDRLEPFSRGAALGELLANSPVVNADPERAPALLNRWEEILQSVPVHRLHFRKANTFWEVIDAHFA